MRSSFSFNTGRFDISNVAVDQKSFGGAIIARNSALGITISDSTLNNNTVTGYGGAVYAYSSPITIVNSTLNNNTVTGVWVEQCMLTQVISQ